MWGFVGVEGDVGWVNGFGCLLMLCGLCVLLCLFFVWGGLCVLIVFFFMFGEMWGCCEVGGGERVCSVVLLGVVFLEYLGGGVVGKMVCVFFFGESGVVE